MPTYRVDSGKHTLWEGDKETGEHFDVVPGDEFTIKKLPPALLPYVTKVTSDTTTKRTKKTGAVVSTGSKNETDDEDTGITTE